MKNPSPEPIHGGREGTACALVARRWRCAVQPPLLLLVLSVSSWLALTAQEPPPTTEPPELTQYRQQFTLRALGASRTLAEQYANALSTIAKDAGAAGDYEQALTAMRRREEITELYSKSLNDPALSNVIVLKPSEARVNGAVNYDRNANALTGWKTVGSIATWEVPRVTPGSYEVTITYGVADLGEPGRVNPSLPPPDMSTGGEFEFYEDSSLAGAGQNRRTGQVTSTGGWTNLATLTLPALQLSRSSARFALKITRTRGEGGVMHLKEIRLAPPKPASPENAAPSGTAAATPEDAFAKLNEAHVERLRQILTSVVAPHANRLNSLAETAAAANDAETAEELRSEAQRVAALQANPKSALASAPSRGRPGLMRASGFKELNGATYVENENNTGDRFLVEHDGQQFPVRLLWVSCPPPFPEARAALEAHAAYFGISAEDAFMLGRRARKFTASFLENRSLTLITRGTKDPDGALLAAVHPAGVGDFAGVLVDNGLALIHEPTAKSSAVKRYEEAVLQALKDRENAAKARRVPPGAWALTNDE